MKGSKFTILMTCPWLQAIFPIVHCRVNVTISYLPLYRHCALCMCLIEIIRNYKHITGTIYTCL